MIKISEEKIIEKLGPGQIIAIDLKKGKLYKAIKDLLPKIIKI